MKRTVFKKILAGHLIVITILTAAVLLFSFRTIRTYYLDTLTENLKAIAVTLKLKVLPILEDVHRHAAPFPDGERKISPLPFKGRDGVGTWLSPAPQRELDMLAKKLGKEINARITVTDTEGFVLADSERSPASMENLRDRPEIAEALKGNIGKALRFSTILKEDMLYVAIPVEMDGKTLGVLRVSLFIKDVNTLLGHLKWSIVRIAAAITLISLLFALFFSRSLSKSVRSLVDASQKIADGDFSVKVELKKEDELKVLADNFNLMASRINDLFTEISCRKENLNSIVSSIQEGLVVLDKDDRILLGNGSFKRIVKNDFVAGKLFNEVLAATDFEELLKKVREEEKGLVREIELDGRHYLCGVAFSCCFNQVVATMQDITEIRNLEKMKKAIVSNVSHELRTPLTAIKGFTETLLEGEQDDESRHYLEIIMKHTNRLISIVSDLLVLSELEENGVKLRLEDVDLTEVAGNIKKSLEQRAKEKGLEFKLDVKGHIPVVKADLFKLEQVFINLIDNAVKYTEKGEVRVSLSRKDLHVFIDIEDTGIGIPKEHLDRIFERFYVVDKARSKKVVGTGLGLAIVKHIVQLHQGSINVESAPNIGTKFTVALPVAIS